MADQETAGPVRTVRARSRAVGRRTPETAAEHSAVPKGNSGNDSVRGPKVTVRDRPLSSRLPCPPYASSARPLAFDASQAMELPGHGICEHKNVYSTKTLLGNWTEDVYGRALQQCPHPFPTVLKSEAGTSFIDPRQMDDRQTRNAPPMPPRPRDLPRHALFGHGLSEAYDPKVPMQYVSMSDATLQGRMRTDDILACKPNVWLDVDKPHFEANLFQSTASFALESANTLRSYDPAPTRYLKSTFLFQKPQNQTDYVVPVRRSSQFTRTFQTLTLQR